MSVLYKDDDGFDTADYMAEVYEGEVDLLYQGVAFVPRDTRHISRVIGAGGFMLKHLQLKHDCRITYSRAVGGFLITSGSRRKIAAAKRDVAIIVAAVPVQVVERLPFDIRIIRGDHGVRLTMVQRSFGVKIVLRPLTLKCMEKDAAGSLHLLSPFDVEATVIGSAQAVARVLRYYEAVDESVAWSNVHQYR